MSAVRLVSTLDMPREKWLEIRNKGIGGSEIGAIAGVNPWETPLAVYLRKVGELDPPEENDAMYWGTVLEDVVASEFARRHPEWKIRRINYVLQHPEIPYFLANIDREIRRKDHKPMLLEIKTSSAWNAGNWRDDVPDHVMAQVQWYLGVLGYVNATVAVLIGGNDYREIDIGRDDEIIEYLQIIGKRFWEEHVIPRVPPAVEPGDIKTADQLYPESNGTNEYLPATIAQYLTEYNEAREAEKAAIERKKKAEAAIKMIMGERERGIHGEYEVRWPSITASRLDTKALRKDHPEIYAQYIKQSSYRRFTVSEGVTQ